MYNIDTAELTTMGSSIFMVLTGLDYKSIAPLLLFCNDHCLQVSSLLLLCLNFLNDRCEIWFVLETYSGNRTCQDVVCTYILRWGVFRSWKELMRK